MKLVVILSRQQVGEHGADTSLERAARKKGIEYMRLIEEEVVLDDLRHMKLPKQALLYRISLSAKATAIEALLSRLYPQQITTIYHVQTNAHPRQVFRELSEQMAAGLCIIPTSIVDETWLKMSDEELGERLARVGGLPVVLKTLGLSHGQGVQKVDTLVDFREKLRAVDMRQYKTIIRRYLPEYRHYRLIVVDGAIVAAIEYHKPEGDFRTNAATEPVVTAVDVTSLDESVQELALKGVELRASILGGVDVLVEEPTNMAYLAEVNVPCYFPRAELPTGVDVATLIIDAMLQKQQRKSLRTIGGVETVNFPELHVSNIHARIDTGAKTSSIWASEIEEQDGTLSFVLFGKESAHYTEKVIRTKQYEKRMVASSNGIAELRYVVRLLVELGGKRIRASFTLADRSTQVYPVLVGRRTLVGKFVVNVQLGKRLTHEERERSRKLQANLEDPE